MHIVAKRLTKWMVRSASVFLPEARAHDLERWRRGREDYWKFRRCDYVFASYGKSGRTWVRVMISRYFQLAHGLPDGFILGFDNFHKLDPSVPRIFFTHDNYLRQYLGHPDSKQDFYDRRTVLLVRKPQDVAVSQFFQWKYRMRPYKKTFNRYPEHDADISLYDFVFHEHQGLPRIVRALNDWQRELDRFEHLLVVRYEDLRSETEAQLARLMDFLGEDVNQEHIRGAVEFATVEKMRKMEAQNYFWRSGSRVQARDKDNPDSYKTRKAKVGGYRDYFDDEQVASIDAYVNERLLPGFGYTEAEQAATHLAAPAGEQAAAAGGSSA
jgi:hypothetical protein